MKPRRFALRINALVGGMLVGTMVAAA